MAEFFNDSIKGLEELKKALQDTKEELQETISLQNKRAKDIDITKAQAKEMTELAKAAQQVAKAEQQIEIINEKQAKTLQQLEKVKAEELKTAQQKQKLDVATKKEKERLNKLAEKERKNAEKLNGEYAKQSKKLNDLRKKYKNLRLETGKNSKETKDLQKEIQELDKTLKDVDAEVGQFQRNVGNYPKATGRAKAGLQTLFGFISGVFIGGLTKSRKATREFQLMLDKAGVAIRILAFELLDLFKKQILPFMDNLSIKFEKLSFSIDNLKGLITGDEGVSAKLKEFDNRMRENDKTMESYSFSLDKLNKIYKQTAENLDDNNDAVDRAIDKNAILRDQIEELQITEQVLEANIGNSNFSMQEREAQVEALIKVQDEIIGKEREMAEVEAKIAENLIVNNLLEQQAITTDNEKIRQRIRSLDFLNDKNLADAVQIENLEKLTAANTKLNEIEGRSQLQDATALKERLDNRRDFFEQELDFTLDIGDRQKAVNERLIASDQIGVKEKFKVLAETEGILNKSYEEQLRLTDEFISESIELRKKELNPKEREELEKKFAKFDLDRIVNLEDEKQIRKELLDAGLGDEITQNRIREIIIERKAALQDVADLQEEVLAQAREEQITQEDAEFALRESRRQIAADNADFNSQQKIEDFEETEKFNQAKLDSAKKALKEEKKLQKLLIIEQKTFELERAETAEDRIRIEEEEKQALLEIDREYYEQLEDLDKSATDKQKENAQELLQEKADTFNKLTSALQHSLDNQTDALISQADKEIADAERAIDKQRDLASRGLDNQLAFEEERLNEANLRKIEIEKEQAQKEELLRLSQIFGEAYIARLQSGEDTSSALAGATSDTFLYKSVADSIFKAPKFYEGTENVAESLGSPLLQGRDGYVIRVDGQERILNPEHSRMVKGLSNEELAQAGLDKKKGSDVVIDNSQVIEQLKRLNEKPVQQIDIDKLGNIIETLDNGKMKTRTRLKTRGRL